MPAQIAPAAPPFPWKSLLLFATGAVILRLLSMTAWVFFPGDRVVPQVARILIPLGFSAGLVVLNQRSLARDGFAFDVLGLKPTARHGGGFLAGAGVSAGIITLIGGVFWLLLPFHYQRGPLSFAALGLHAAEYLGGNAAEELVFRGYLLLLLRRQWGLMPALAITGLLFGLSHLPGLSGMAALKMVCTTFLGGCLFAYGFMLTGTLWTAIGLHVAGNIWLHQVLGLSGQRSILTPVMDRAWPDGYDPAFAAWLAIMIPVVAAAALQHQRQRQPAG
jgi:membrane protease YdiL (CAAX protease family)